MDNIIKHIYRSCDPNTTDSVPVSSLIDFIKPYMPDHLEELHELQVRLDPNNANPSVSSTEFYETMSDWIAKIKEEDLSSSLSEASHSGGSEEEKNLSLQLAFFGFNQLSMSTSSSNNNNKGVVGDESMTLKEQVRKLEYVVNKTTNELDLVKQQLALAEEQNESLSTDLNRLHKSHYREQQINEKFRRDSCDSNDVKEDANVAKKKIDQLERVLTNFEKQQQTFLGQISQLENENLRLKNKLKHVEKSKLDTKKSVSELRDSLDVKDEEISTLQEVIEELKGELEKKAELVTFYTNENNLIKQKTRSLENLLNEVFPNGEAAILKQHETQSLRNAFNSPKLLKQLANPVSPTLNSPINFRKCKSSSPINTDAGGVDLFANGGIVTVLRSPHKNLKEELFEVSKGQGSPKKTDIGEVQRLLEVLKEQEHIKNSLWENMKHLSADNETLQSYRKDYQELVYDTQKKDETIQHLRNQLSDCKTVEDKSTETEEIIEKIDKSTETEKEDKSYKELVSDVQGQNEYIRRLSIDLEATLINLNRLETEKNQVKEVEDKSTATEKEDIIWNIPTAEAAEPKKTNFAKQQMKMERLLEKQEKTKKELDSERSINTNLTLKQQELLEENKRIREDLETYRDKTNRQADIIADLISEKKILCENAEFLDNEIQALQLENRDLQENQASERHEFNENMQNAVTRVVMETSVVNGLRTENQLLINKHKQLELRLKEERIKQLHLKNQVIDLRTTNNLTMLQLQKDIAEKDKDQKFQLFLVVNNNELGNTASAVLSRFITLFGDEIGHLEEVNSSTGLDKEMATLTNNIKLAIVLLEVLIEKCANLLEPNMTTESQAVGDNHNQSQSIFDYSIGSNATIESQAIGETFCVSSPISDSSYDDALGLVESSGSDSFNSCGSEISTKELLEIMPFEIDSFLDNLELNDEDLRELSKKEMEDKFMSLALILTIDFTTSNRRCLNQKERCSRLMLKFFAYLNYSINLLGRFDRSTDSQIHKTAIMYLELLKNLSGDVFKSAAEFGVVQYEKRTVNCWNLVINYVAALSQENRQIKQMNDSFNGSKDSSQLVEIKPAPTRNLRSKCMCYFKTILSLLFILIFVLVLLIVYVDQLCPKDGKRVCPLESILHSFMQKTYSDHVF